MAAAFRRFVARRTLSTQAAGSKWPEGVAVVSLDRPASRNALSLDFLQTLRQRFADASAQDGAKVIVLEAQGPVFSAGHDLKELVSADRDTLSAVFSTAGALCSDIRSLPQPVIARVHALATAAGCQLAAACDVVVARESAKFATPGVHVGLFCSTPAVELSRSVHAKVAMKMLLTGDPITAHDALQAGLVSSVTEDSDEALDAEVASLATKMLAKSSAVLAFGKAGFYRQAELPVADAYKEAAAAMTTNMTDIEDARRGIGAFVAKESPVWSHK